MVKTSFRCEQCEFKFRRNDMPKLCPMCGAQAVVQDRQDSAADILKDVEEVLD